MMIGFLLLPLLMVLLLIPHNDERSSRGLSAMLLIGLIVVFGVGSIGMGGMHSWGWSGWSWPGLLMSIVLLGAVGASIWLVLRRSPAPEREDEQILRLRLAKGEITAEEYDLLKNKLRPN